MHITPYLHHHRDSVLDLSIRAWAPVFAVMRDDVPGFVYDNFYPEGWEARQRADLVARRSIPRSSGRPTTVPPPAAPPHR
ncbi:MAG: hypothetical protein QJR09_03430 [Micrococcus sp.]|nr:hypothetical protein [Micrococcus sp.]